MDALAAANATQNASDTPVLDAFENFFYHVPGGKTAIGRAAWAFAAGYVTMEAIKPTVSYNADGSKRPFIWFNPDSSAHPTYIPWWAPPAAAAIAAGMFV